LIAVPIAAAIAVAVLASLALVQGSSATGRRPAAASADPALGPAGNVDAVRRAIANGAVVVDVRTDAEWSAGSLPGAVHIPLAQVPERYQELPRGQRVVTVCKDGGLSGKAADALRQVGYDVVNLDGGLTAWVAAGLPVVDASGGSGEVL
jgi:rhodanese-related sulfurtransferase